MSDLFNVQANFGGVKEMNTILLALPKSTGRSVLQKAWRWALKPFRSGLRAAVDVDSGDLKKSIKIVTLRTRGDNAARLAVGPTQKWYVGAMLEWGTKYIEKRRWAQPVWDRLQQVLIFRFARGVSASLMNLAHRLDKKARAGKLTPVDKRILG